MKKAVVVPHQPESCYGLRHLPHPSRVTILLLLLKGKNSAVAFTMKGVKLHAVNNKGTERKFVCDDSLEILVV
jgi:hypothetical protein